MKHSSSQKWVLITGASDGIGKELSYLFAKDHYSLLLTARSADKLKTLCQELSSHYNVQALSLPLDLSLPDSVQKLFDFVHKKQLPISVLVNNAGFGTYGFFHKLELKRELSLIDLNIKALVSLSHLFIPLLLKQKVSYILNLASVAAFAPGPLMASYYASKAFVLSFSQALSQELKNTSISVTTFCPGPTSTSFFKSAQMAQSPLTASYLSQTPKDVALLAYKSLFQRKRLVVSAFKNKLTVFFFHFLPRKVLLPLLFRFQASK